MAFVAFVSFIWLNYAVRYTCLFNPRTNGTVVQMRIEFIVFLAAYFILLFLVSFFFSRKMKNIDDFFLASRKLPAFLVFLSLAASWVGATSTLVSVDEAYRNGVSSFWVMGIPAILTVLVFAFFLAPTIRRLPIVSLPDLVELRYGPLVRHMSAVLIVWYMILLAASQMTAMGNFLKLFTGTSYLNSLILGTAVVLMYSVFGGFFSVVVTDGFQFFLLAAGIFGLFIFLCRASSINDIPLLASQLGRGEYLNIFFDLKRNLLTAFSFTLAWIISPIAWQRIQSARSEQNARQGLFAAGATLFLVYGLLIMIGMFSLPLFSSGDQEGPILSALIFSKTGYILGGILFIAITAAIMSTMDTAINTGALSLTRDVYQQVFSSQKETSLVIVGRISTVVIGALAFLIATEMRSILKTLGLASEILTEGLFIPGIVMIYLKKRKPWAGFLSLMMGGGYAVTGFFCEVKILHLNWPDWPYTVPYGLALCAAGFLAGLVIDHLKKPQTAKRKT